MFGVGRFYVGSNTIDGLQLGLSVAGFFLSIFVIGLPILIGVAVWALVDAIILVTGDVTDGYGRKLR